MSDTVVVPPAAPTTEDRAVAIFRAHFAVLDKENLDLHVAIRFLTNKGFRFVTTSDTPFSAAGRIFSGRIIGPQLSWSRLKESLEAEITFYLSVDAFPIVALKPYDPEKGQWAAMKRSPFGDEDVGIGVLYLD